MEKSFAQKIVDGEPTTEVALEAMKHYSDRICDALNPMYNGDIIFILAALKNMEETLSRMDKDAMHGAEILSEMIGKAEIVASMPAGTPEDAVEKIYDAMKQM